MKDIEKIIEIIGGFKDLKRTGWCLRQVRDSESVAEHSFSITLLTFLLAPDNLNRTRCLELSLIHDLPEFYTGDMVPNDKNISQKPRLEKEAVERLSHELKMPRLIELFAEYEAQETEEAKFVKGLDKLECAMQACYYDKNHRSPVQLVPEFLGNCENWLYHHEQHPLILEILSELKKGR